MSRRSSYSSRSSLTHTSAASRSKDIWAIILAALGLFLVISIYTEAAGSTSGTFGYAIKSFFSGLFGYFVYALPVILIVLGILIFIARKKRIHGSKLGMIVLFLIALLPFLHTFAVNATISANSLDSTVASLDPGKVSFGDFLLGSYKIGSESHAGTGLWSAIFVYPIWLLIGEIGSYILYAAIMLASIIILTNLSIRKVGQRIGETVSTMKENNRNGKSGLYVGKVEEPNAGGYRKEREEPAGRPKDDIVFRGHFEEKENEKFTKTLQEHEAAKQTVKTQTAPPPENSLNHGQTDVEYIKPPLNMLSQAAMEKKSLRTKDDYRKNAHLLEETLANFGITAKVVQVSTGPAVTRYELQLAPGVKVSRITSLADDIALNLASQGVRIEAPIPGKAAVGIEVPNSEISIVRLSECIDTQEFSKHPSPIAFPLGKDIAGSNIIVDLGSMPHLLVAGATGSGKSVCINSFIAALLFKSSPQEVRLIMIDPKVVELSIYNGIPHLLIPVVTDPKKAAGALNWAITEMTSRYKLFAEKGAKDIKRFNELAPAMDLQKIPHIVVIIDELADLMMAAPREVEDAICRLAQLGRASGIHLIVATQRPSVDVITGLIKANIPSRIAFAVSSQVDSRTILDSGGAEKLLGRGDMLYSSSNLPKPIRIQGSYVSDKEVESVVSFVKAKSGPSYKNEILDHIDGKNEPAGTEQEDGRDELLSRAVEIVIESGQASTSLLQRKLRVGYARAARLIDDMEEMGIVGGYDGSKPRNVLINRSDYEKLFGGSE